MKKIFPGKQSLLLSIVLCCSFIRSDSQRPVATADDHPRIVNIVNFIRLLEPRVPEITEDVLYQTVVSQIEIMKKYRLKGTFLLQYDALMDPRYQQLLKSLPAGDFEIGAWWEIPQPLVENAGLTWRGRYPWDWRADVGFSTGYSPAEREKLADVYMRNFKKIFGYYPQSVGSWFIDAHTLNYLYEHYGITASSNCKDQIGTDGYTLWGGYWNQAYYPSKRNAYMPAQHADQQIPVPIFRMLGSDPVRQYDNGLGTTQQGVVTLEPVYSFGGGNAEWVDWYFRELVNGASMAFGYTQAGQENSFTWKSMSKGFEIQMPLIAKLRDEHQIRVETLGESGRWFRAHYPVTPATSVTVNRDIAGSDRKTVWFDSRFYRTNLLWEAGSLCFRDIHLFDENLPSIYEKQKASTDTCTFFTLPFVDGYRWSSRGKRAALWLMTEAHGKEMALTGGEPRITDSVPGHLLISWPLTNMVGTLRMDLDEREIKMEITGAGKSKWFLELTTAKEAALPFHKIGSARVDCRFEGMNYGVNALTGKFLTSGNGSVFRVMPAMNQIALNLCATDKP